MSVPDISVYICGINAIEIGDDGGFKHIRNERTVL